MVQRPRIGLKDVVYAVLDEATDIAGGTPSYGTVYPLTNAIELSFDPGSSASILFADDGAAFSAETVGEMSVSFGQADLLPEDVARLLGHTYANGIITKNVSDVSPYVAIGAKRMMSGGQYEYFWLNKVILTKPKMDAKTKADKIDFQTPMFEGKAVKLTATGNYHSVVRTDDSNALSATLTGWFTQPVISSSADLGVLNVVVAKSTTKATFTFTKVGGGLITLTQAQLIAANLPVYKGSNAVPQAGAYVITNNGTANVTVTFTPTAAFTAVAVAGAVAPNKVYDQSGVAATQTGAVWTSD
jgi:phi13 family phage major tail protein